MKYLSLRLQIFLLVALAVMAVATSSFRSTWTFLLQDKLASLRELQTLSLLSTLQDMRLQSQDLREEMRSLAVSHYKSPDQVNTPFQNIPSLSGSYIWKELSLTSPDTLALVPKAPSSSQVTTPKSHTSAITAGMLTKSLLFDPQEILQAPMERGPASHQEVGTSTSPKEKLKPKWSYTLVQEGDQNYLLLEETLTLGNDGAHYLLRGKISANVLTALVKKIQFESIDVHLFKQNQNFLDEVLGESKNINIYKPYIQKALSENSNQEIEAQSISIKVNEEQSFVSYAKLRLPDGNSNILLAFVAEEAKLVAEFRAFLAEQIFILLSILGGALLAGYFITRLITQPVSELVEATRDLERGAFHRRVEIEARNEIGRLAQAFNHLGKTLQEREEALANAENNMRQLSFQTDIFKRLTHFSDKIAKILNPEDLLSFVMDTWSQLLNVSPESNHLAFYQFDSSSRRHVLRRYTDSSTNFPPELGPELWNNSLKFNSGTYEITNADTLSLFPLQNSRDRVFRLPILGENKIYGILVFTALEIQDAEYFEMLIMECQRLLSTSFEAANRYAILQEASIRDGLTGLFNVRFFKECVEKELAKASQNGEPASLLFFDVDHFKKYNDTHGHPAGDRVLKQVASLMRSSFDPKDILARYGGEEFVILLKNTDHSEAMLQAERFRAVVEEAKFENEHTQPLGFVSISMGVSTYPEHAQDMASLIKMADDALYRAKKTSRNVVVSAQTLLENSSSDSSAA